MSPDEQQLRTALRRDDGDRIDADAVIALARTRTRARRVRWAGTAGGVVAVLTAALVWALVPGHGGSDGAPAAAAGGVVGASRVPPSSPVAGRPGLTVYRGCPKQPPVIPIPAVASVGSPLLPATASSVIVCVYDLTGPEPVGALLTAPGSLVSALNESASGRVMHPDACSADGGATVTLSAGGVTAVGNLGGCGTITNGRATAYARTMLAQLAEQVAAAG